jgi:DNA-binding transcriptional ArsR family regulator
MKTQTRSKILELIEKNGKVRPSEFVEFLKLSPQAIHRHLRILSDEGIIEAKGSPPFTQYALAGIPDLEAVAHWINAQTLENSPPSLVCETRETLAARLPHLKSLLKEGLQENMLPLVISTVGEIGNNSFDHNMGQWRDVPGCWLESQVTQGHLWIWIADRGQGVFQSLNKVHPEIRDDQAALKAAFETIISGRAPEKRGNGLKYVKQNLSGKPGHGLACISGTGRVNYGEQGNTCIGMLDKYFTNVKGTVTLMVWRLQ